MLPKAMPPRMSRKPEVAITLTCCPRCGWPNDEAVAAPAAVQPVTAPTVTAAPKRPPGRPRKTPAGPMTARDYGLTASQWNAIDTDTPATSWYKRDVCERQGHTHGEDGLMKCMLLNLANATAEQQRNPSSTKNQDSYRREVCEKEGHMHPADDDLTCALLRIAALRSDEAKGKGAR